MKSPRLVSYAFLAGSLVPVFPYVAPGKMTALEPIALWYAAVIVGRLAAAIVPSRRAA